MINFVTKPVPTDGIAGSVSAMAGNNDFTGLHANIGMGGERGGVMIDATQKKVMAFVITMTLICKM